MQRRKLLRRLTGTRSETTRVISATELELHIGKRQINVVFNRSPLKLKPENERKNAVGGKSKC